MESWVHEKASRWRPWEIVSILLCFLSFGAQAADKTPPGAAGQVPAQVKEFVHWELGFNPVSQDRSEKAIPLEDLEIPAERLHLNTDGLSEELRHSLFFQGADGVEYFRWVLNPEDTRFGQELEAKLRDEGIPFRKARTFMGYLTSSRSTLVVDPESGRVFSYKTSTSLTGGIWKDKKETERAAQAGKLVSDHIRERLGATKNESFAYLYEPVAATFGEADQGAIVREYPYFNEKNPKKVLVPFFSILQTDLGREIALENGAGPEGVHAYWARHLFAPWGKATAEIGVNAGVFSTSGHSQNFLLEVEKKNGKLVPTGKIFARDLSDGGIFAPFALKGSRGKELIEHYLDSETPDVNPVYRNELKVDFAPYNGTSRKLPDWVKEADVKDWSRSFFKGFAARFRELTALDPELQPDHVDPLNRIIMRTKVFTPEELEVALDQVPASRARPAGRGRHGRGGCARDFALVR